MQSAFRAAMQSHGDGWKKVESDGCKRREREAETACVTSVEYIRISFQIKPKLNRSVKVIR